MKRDRLLTTGEAAEALGVDRTTLTRWAREGKVKPTWVTPGTGGHYRWDLDDLKGQLGIPRANGV